MRHLARWFGAMLFIAITFAAVGQESPFGSYTYDGSGNITSIGSDTFIYDELGRLKSATLSHGAAQTFTYDRYGNILTVTTAGDPIVKKPGVDKHSNQIDQPLDDNGNPNNVVGTYDARGNLVSYPYGTFVYDGLEMMKEATVAGTRRFHIYSASDERVATLTSPGTGDWTIRDPGGRPLRRLAQTNGTFAWTEDYIYRDDQLLAAVVPDAEKVRHFHVDHLGTPRLVTGNGGVQVAEHHYQPFGPELPSFTNDTEKAKFTGHERDATTLDYMHARFYDPFLGRFLSVDPTWESADVAKPQSWNRYSYVLNNPANLTDPDGKCPYCIEGVELGKATWATVAEYTTTYVLDADATGASADLPKDPAQRAAFLEQHAKDAPGRTRPSTLSPGPHADESIPARNSQPKFTPEERAKMNEVGRKSGCHTCGATDPGTRSGNFVPDHQPPSATKPPSQRLYPHCINCSRAQGGAVRKFLRELLKKLL